MKVYTINNGEFMLKTMMVTTLSMLAFTAHAETGKTTYPESLYLFEVKDKLKSFEGTYAMGLDKNILMYCNNKEKEKDNLDYNCKIDLKTVNDFDINNKTITGIQMMIIPLSIEKDALKANIVYKQRLDPTHTLDYVMMDQSLKVNKKNEIKLTENNKLYITLKKEKY